MSNDILDELYEKLEDCQHYGSYLAAICIFHNDSRPSLMVYPDTYRCLSCNAHGKTSDLLRKLGSNFIPKVSTKTDFHNPFTKWNKTKSLGETLKIAHLTLKTTPSMGSYMVERGITIDVQLKLGMGYRDDWYTIPIRNSDKLIVGAVARKNCTNQHPAKYIIPSGQNPNLLYVPDWKMVKTSNVVFLTFGILDAISIYMCGYPAMSTTTGKRINPEVLSEFRKRIVIFPDKGEEYEALDLSGDLGWRGKVFKCQYTFDAKDPNDLFLRYTDDFKLMLKGIVENI